MSVGLIKRSITAMFIVSAVLLIASHSQITGAAAFENQGDPPKQNPAGGPPQLAEERFKNIQIFKGQPAQNVLRAMMFFTKSLGVECSFCHVQGAMDKDDKDEKKFARTMYQIVQFANKSIGAPKVSCYTCHRGHQEPEVPADLSKAKVEEMFKKADEDKRPAETVYKNIQVLKGQNAGRVMTIMQLITKDLGVKCDFCHVVPTFEKDDKPHKATARQMMTMMGGIAKEFTHGEVIINCYTCHKGQPEPVSFPPQDATAKPDEHKPHPDATTKPEEKKPPR